MTKSTQEGARLYGLKETSTPEKLELDGFKTIAYGDKTICTGYRYSPDGKHYYAATYEFTSKQRTTCEDECRLRWASAERYEDEGHAIAAEIARITKNA